MQDYIKELTMLIRDGDMQNTYKMAWARAIVETCVLDDSQSIIHFDALSEKIFGYYWNQSIFFNLNSHLIHTKDLKYIKLFSKR